MHVFYICKYMHYAVLCLVAKSCLTLCNPMNCSPPCSSVHGILQAIIVEWVAISYSKLGCYWHFIIFLYFFMAINLHTFYFQYKKKLLKNLSVIKFRMSYWHILVDLLCSIYYTTVSILYATCCTVSLFKLQLKASPRGLTIL